MMLFEEWMDRERLSVLKRDEDEYRNRMIGQYSEETWDRKRKEARHREKEDSNKWLLILLAGVGAAIATIVFEEGFLSGVLFIVVVLFTGFALNHHHQNAPDFARMADPRTEEEIKEEFDLNDRLRSRDHDRRRWLKHEYGHDGDFYLSDQVQDADREYDG